MSAKLFDFWPTSENCRDCLITAAESASDAVFLAVHQSMPLSRRLLSSRTGEAEPKNEQDLLEAFLTKNLPSGTLILPIVGSSGVGKSHMIRWLDANMRERGDGVNRHIVRIPRSSSLRRVLELILATEGADANVKSLLSKPRYRDLNQAITSATLPPTLKEATHQLRGNLLIALENAYMAASDRLASGAGLPDDPARRAHCSDLKLPALLEDPVIKKHFMFYQGEDLGNYGILARIASRCIDGQREVDDASSVFTVEDLIVDASFDRADMTAPVRQYLTALERREGAGRHDAVKFLNELIDDAISQLLAFGGFSLTDLFVEIRKSLLEDNIELVLLIEDFAALAGIQGSLLDAIISEGVRGEQELCTMRTALAVTEGYLSNRETVSTRADYEWKIDDYPFASEAEAVRIYTRFVAGYLNAARWGKAYIEQKYQQREGLSGDWLPDYFESKKDDLSTGDIDMLDAFGRDELGGMLFPFNEGVIRQLITRYLKDQESYKFNPRELIKRVLHGTLVDFRAIYLEGSFPPETYQNFSFRALETSVSGELRSRISSEMYGRMSAFVYHWGDNPRTVGQAAAIDRRVYSAFSLPEVNWSVVPEEREPLDPAVDIDRVGQNRALTADERKVEQWKELLRRWKEEEIIVQGKASDLRNMIIESAWEHVDWNALLLVRPDVGLNIRNKIRLPRVTTNNPEEKDAIVVALSDEDWGVPEKVDQFFGAINAMCSFNVYKSWNYEGGEVDSVNYRNFLEGISEQVTSYYYKQYKQMPRDGLVPLAQALLIGARVLNLPGATSNAHVGNVLAICSDSGELEAQQIDGKWWELYNQALGCRKDMLEILYSQATSRQGQGTTLLAVDAALLLRAIEGIRDSWSLGDVLTMFKDQQDAVMKSHIRFLKDGVQAVVEQRLESLKQWSDLMAEWFPGGYDYKDFQEVALESIRTSKKAAEFACGDVSSDVLKRRISELEGLGVSSLLTGVQLAKDAEGVGPKLGAVAKVDQLAISRAESYFKLYEQFLSETGDAVDERVNNAPLNINTVAGEKIKQIEEIESLWAKFEEVQS